jgi:hypothetical protein
MITMLLSRNLLSNGKRRTGTLIVLSLTSIVATVVRMDADFGPAADVKAVRTAIEQGRLPPGIEQATIEVTDVAVVGNFALGTYRAGSTISQQGLCRWHGAWNRIFAGVAGTVDLIHAGYPPDVAKEMVAHLEESRGVDQLGRDPQASAEDRKTFGPEAIAAAAKQFKPSARCEYPAALSAPLSPK